MDVPGQVALKSFVELKTIRDPKVEGFAMHSNAKKVKMKHGKKMSSIVAGRNHDLPSNCSHSKQVECPFKRLC